MPRTALVGIQPRRRIVPDELRILGVRDRVQLQDTGQNFGRIRSTLHTRR